MTVVLYQVTPARVMVATDTLACDATGIPAALLDKCEVVPHLNVAIAGNGYGPLVDEWAHELRTTAAPACVDELNEIAPDALRDLWQRLEPSVPVGGCARASVYLFGVSERDGACRGFVYKSETGFSSTGLPVGAVGISPVPTFSDYAVDTVADWVELAVRLREQGLEPKVLGGRPTTIGGDLMLTVLTPGSVAVTRVHRFDDREAQGDALAHAGELIGR